MFFNNQLLLCCFRFFYVFFLLLRVIKIIQFLALKFFNILDKQKCLSLLFLINKSVYQEYSFKNIHFFYKNVWR
jgi:hypothetical protein